jgi:hypothetical protein
MRHSTSLNGGQNERLASAALLLPEHQRVKFIRSVRNRLDDLPRRFSDRDLDRDLDRIINFVMAGYGVSLPANKQRRESA